MLSEPIVIRRATVDDIPFLRAMMQEAYLASPSFLAHHSMEQIERYEERLWQEWRERPEPAFVAVDSAGRRKGGLRLSSDDSPDGHGWVIGVGIEADARHQGVGQRLMEAAISYARMAGDAYLFLMVDPANAAAIALYRRTGFLETGAQEHAISMRLTLREPAR